jgi:hypothetical protein
MRLVEDRERLLAEIDLAEGALAEQLDRATNTAVQIFGVDGAGLMLRLDANGMQLIAGSSEAARALERAQTALQAGPGYAATERRSVVTVRDMATDGR